MLLDSGIKSALFLVESPFQLFEAIAIAEAFDQIASRAIVINARFTNAARLAERLESVHLFDNVVLVDPQYGDSRKTGILHSATSGAMNCEQIQRIINSLTRDRFDALFCSNGFNLSIDLKNALVKDGVTCMLDDGIGSRDGACLKAFSCVDRIANPARLELHGKERLKSVAKSFLRAFTKKKYLLNIQYVFLFEPTDSDRSLYKGVTIVPIPHEGRAFREYCDVVFGKGDEGDKKKSYVFLAMPDNVPSSRLDEEEALIEAVFCELGDDLMLRPHPRRTNFRNISSDITIDSSCSLWEKDWADGVFDNDTVLLGIDSSALMNPKLLFGKEPAVVLLFNIVRSESPSATVAGRTILDALHERYEQPDKVKAPASVSELLADLSSLQKLKEFGCHERPGQ